ncbi:glycerophosphodiester phosphodiesterase [Sphingobacterium tabacisoli]|uniref:Glycerophosphodiester phosphodiesterase n=1 Tax=Sphingobacterium tabacisoli TaxID=2044855 RepID=A0ABW5KY15_9SPHI|nr:glycerophosphodiester phosphodiesterase family protein [Sphingobacterium tabacisoli]
MKRLATLFLALFILNTAGAQETKIIAHRGAWKNTHAPQNSIAALQEAIKQGVWGSEFDVHMTKDGILVVNHDNDFYGIDIATSTYEELLAKKHPNGEKIPTAEEYLKEGLKQKKTKLIYELKTNRLGVEETLKSAELSLALIKKLHANKMVEIIAFSWDACLKLRSIDKKIKIHYLNGDKNPTALKEAKLSGFDYNINALKANPTWIEEAHNKKLNTNVWTVNKQEDMQYFIQQKINYITTDEPELLHTVLSQK